MGVIIGLFIIVGVIGILGSLISSAFRDIKK